MKLTQLPDGWSALEGRFLIVPAKGAPVFVVARGPKATKADAKIADRPLAFDSVDEARAWLEQALTGG